MLSGEIALKNNHYYYYYIWNRLPSNVVNASNVMCFEKRLDKCWADLKIKFDHEAPLN